MIERNRRITRESSLETEDLNDNFKKRETIKQQEGIQSETEDPNNRTKL